MVEEDEIINILLLGETGVGKSTVINAIANYITYNSLSEAAKQDLIYLVPTKFSLYDDNFKNHTIIVGSSPDEDTEAGVSATQRIQSYLIKYKNTTVRLIDTPGIGDTRGIAYDEENAEKLLTFIGELHHLNAVCILLKPNESRFSVLFDYCLKYILSRLDKQIYHNIVFLFTNARLSFYTPGDTYVPLKTALDKLNTNESIIPFNNFNMFCVDNESFRYLAAKFRGFAFKKEEIEEYEKSWDKSSDVCKKMIDYISLLPQTRMQGAITINESRRIIGRLGKPIIELLALNEKALIRLESHGTALRASQDTLSELRSKLYVPITVYKVTEKSWAENDQHGRWKGGLTISRSYPFISLDLGYQHTWNSTRYTEIAITPYVTSVEDNSMKAAINSKESALRAVTKIITEMNNLENEYRSEREIILQAAARFIMFLRENAILKIEDVFENYLGRLMRSETILNGDETLRNNLEDVLVQYRMIKKKMKNVTPEEIKDHKEKLVNLKHSGNNFKELLEKKFYFDDKDSMVEAE